MNRRLKISLLPLAALALSLAAMPVRADSTTVLASYDAPGTCPPRQTFLDAVAARGAQFNEGDVASAGRSASVSISEQGGRFVGALELRDAAGKSDPRQVEAPSCTEVVDALAVVSALALRPDDVASSVTPAAPVPKVEAPAAPPPVPPVVEEGPRRLRGHTELGTGVLDVTAGKLHLDRDTRIALSAGFMYGVIRSRALPRYDATFSSAKFLTTPSGEQHLQGYIPRLRMTFLGPSSNSSGRVDASAFGVLAAVGGCISPLYDTAGFVVLFCGDLGAGIMSLDTESNGRSKQESQPFWTAELEAEAQYNVGSWFFASLKVGVGYASRFFVPDDWGIRLRPPVNVHAMLGVGAHF